MSYFSADYLKPKYFAARYFGAQSDEEPTRSGWWRLQLYKLQEDSERKRKEVAKDAIREAVEKVTSVRPTTKVERPRELAKPKVVKPDTSKPKLRPLYEPVEPIADTKLPLLENVWAIMQETWIIGLSVVPVRQMLLAKIEAANDEEDVELLLMAA
jgi:hypothetical protein